MKFDTRAIPVGNERGAETGAVISPIYATSTFAPIRPGETKGYDYTRSGDPNFIRLWRTLVRRRVHADVHELVRRERLVERAHAVEPRPPGVGSTLRGSHS